jgi:hypothetical protein
MSFDASGLEPRELRYGIQVQGNEVGSLVTRWTRDGDAFAVVTEQTVPGMSITQTAEFDAATFAPTRLTTDAGPAGQFQLEVRDGRAVGQGLDPRQGPRDVDLEVGPGTALEGQLEIALAVTDYEAVEALTLDVLSTAGSIQSMAVAVTGTETVEVPAGTFETYRLEVSGSQPMTLWVTRSDPHIVVKREIVGQPVSIELTSM